MPRHFDLIAFDWDGTLYDSTAFITRAIQAACREVGVTEPSTQRASYVIGMGLQEALLHAAPELPPQRYPELARAYQRHYLSGRDDLVLFDGVLPMLRALKERNHCVAVATGKSRRGLDEALAAVELAGLFDGTRTADETAPKPDPTMLIELMAEFGASPQRTLMIGDTTHDLQMARSAGVACVGVSYGAHPHAAFDAYAPRFVAHSTAELHDWLIAHG
ncbi:MAG: HAD family hydrolase [Rubrivivax sp.]|jgi:phosphoglycolate phosphatase